MRAQQHAGCAWAVRKFGLRLFRRPHYGEQIRVSTWIQQVKKLTFQREFEMTANGKEVAEASSQWVALDLRRRQITRSHIPIDQEYVIERTTGVSEELKQWTRPSNAPTEFHMEVRLRSVDFDTNGHVNNAAYFDYLETLLIQYYDFIPTPLAIRMQFTREISPDIPVVTVGISPSEQTQYYTIYDKDSVYALGDITIPAEEIPAKKHKQTGLQREHQFQLQRSVIGMDEENVVEKSNTGRGGGRGKNKTSQERNEGQHAVSGMGPTGSCICPRCDAKIPHRRGTPCQEESCPSCGAKMLREGGHHYQLLQKKRQSKRQ